MGVRTLVYAELFRRHLGAYLVAGRGGALLSSTSVAACRGATRQLSLGNPGNRFLLLFGCTALRYLGVTALAYRTLGPEPVLRTHVRLDQLFVGVVIGYWYHSDRNVTKAHLKRLHPMLLTVMAAGLVIVLFAPKQIVLSVGLAVLSIGFGGVVLTAACEEPCDSGRSDGRWRKSAVAPTRCTYGIFRCS